MKVNLRPKTGDKRQSSSNNISNHNQNNPNLFDELRAYINDLESLLKDTLSENFKLKMTFEKKSQSLEKKYQQKAEEKIIYQQMMFINLLIFLNYLLKISSSKILMISKMP